MSKELFEAVSKHLEALEKGVVDAEEELANRKRALREFKKAMHRATRLPGVPGGWKEERLPYGKVVEAIYRALADGQRKSIRDVVNESGLKHGSVAPTMGKLKAHGKVVRHPDATYSLNND